jgi:hypothetical protein
LKFFSWTESFATCVSPCERAASALHPIWNVRLSAAFLGEPLPPDHQRALDAAFKTADEASAVTSIQRVLDCHCLVGVDINPQMRLKVAPGPAKRELAEHGWRQFLVKVHNEAGSHVSAVAMTLIR